jgi:hypothetical protein
MLIASLDPAVSRRIIDHTARSPASKSAGINDRMPVTAGDRAELKRQFDMRYACEYRRERYRTQLAGRQRMLRGALDEDPIVDQPH